MSARATFWAWSVKNLPPVHRLVLLLLADRADTENQVDVRHSEIEEKCDISENEAFEAIACLEHWRLISEISFSGPVKSRTYLLQLHCAALNWQTEISEGASNEA